MEISLYGKVALVTGAAQGIGKAIALALAGAGADVVVNDVSDAVLAVKKEIEMSGRKSSFSIFNVADTNAVADGIKKIRDELGCIDILVNNVGITNNRASVVKMTREKWDWELSINLSGMFNCTKAVLTDMAKSGWGRIIMISSLGALGTNHQVAYAASKAGISGLSKTVAIEHSKDGITCNVILCGLIGSPKVMALPEEVKKIATALIPAGRIGKVEDIANVAVFLSSQQANYITGAEIYADGGAHLPAVSYGLKNFGFRAEGKNITAT